ncbi:heterokaryon incompatibility protein-domain-containing protein [Scleroderma yunnanense]
MYMINVNAFIAREDAIKMEQEYNKTDVLEFRDDEMTDYAILSHRWIGKEVDYKEIIKLARMNKSDQKAIRDRDGYKKILSSCEQAKRDGYSWLWVDTCCIDKRSSAELSEAINSMYRWYANAKICYAYLHDVSGISFPTEDDDKKYPNSNGWPEWFSRGWTLQEMIAPSNVQFFNKDWQCIGDKRTLAPTLSRITQVPRHVLRDGLSSNRPCVAQIMSWAARRKTTRVEDRAYSLLGLLDVNMPMLYGEGKKAFQRLQLEVIRMSNDQSIFAWRRSENERSGSILADDPSFFEDCNRMELLDRNQFIQELKKHVPEIDIPSINEDQFGVFPITNRGIQIWMFLFRLRGSHSLFEAWLPCRDPLCPPVTITLALWNSNYYRYHTLEGTRWRTLQFRQIYLRYQDIHRDVTFKIDDSAMAHNGFSSYQSPKSLTSTDTALFCVKAYSDRAGYRIAVGVGQCFGHHWIHVAGKQPTRGQSRQDFWQSEYSNMLARGPELAQSMAEVCSRRAGDGLVCVKYFCLPGSTWTIRASYVVWEGSLNRGVKIEVFRHPYSGPDKWIGITVEGLGSNDPDCDTRGLMIPHEVGYMTVLRVDGAYKIFAEAPNGIKLGDYGYFANKGIFHPQGNISEITVKQHKISDAYGDNADNDYVKTRFPDVELYKPVGLSVVINDDLKLWLDCHSIELVNKYVVTMIIQCPTVPSSGHMNRKSMSTWVQCLIAGSAPTSGPTTPLCIFSKPFAWYQDEGLGSVVDETS